jgi:hypothetical protein
MNDTSSDEEDMILTLALLSEADEKEKYTTKRQ